MNRSRRTEIKERGRIESGGVDVHHRHGSPPVITAASVQQDRRIPLAFPIASQLHCRRQQLTASLESREGEATSLSAKKSLTPPSRRYSDTSISTNLIHSPSRRTRDGHRASPPSTSCIRGNEEFVRLLPLTSGGMTGAHSVGTGDSSGQSPRSPLRDWQQLEQERPRFRLSPLETKQYCYSGVSQRNGQETGGHSNDFSSGNTKTTVPQLPRLGDPTARLMSKSVMDFSQYSGCSRNICALTFGK